ncbi:MAG: dipeptidase PepE [Formivibrio sp.]|nr:dipeptidase PepE [Formivibrio sp.]
MELLLLSNSKTPEGGYLTHALEPARVMLRDRKKTLFIPYAGVTVGWDEYTDKVWDAFSPLGLEIESAHAVADPCAAVAQAEAIIVGGGNTFQLLKVCREQGLLPAIAARVRAGAAYIGWSAGANLACPTICTTNDMPIADPGGFAALGLIDFQINPHYTNALPVGHQGETRDQRIAELLVANPQMHVLGLPEGDWLEVRRNQASLHGPYPAMAFRAGAAPQALPAGSALSF